MGIITLALMLLAVLSQQVETGEVCKTSKCSIYAFGCPEPWVVRSRTRCFAWEVSTRRMTTSNDDDPFLPMYKVKCCKKVEEPECSPSGGTCSATTKSIPRKICASRNR